MKLAEMTWPEMAAVDREGCVLIAPYAACEQHGPHLPFFVDTILCTAVAEGVEAALPDQVLLLPTQWLGASAHHLPFFGTLSADLDQHVELIVGPISQYLDGGWQKVFVLNGHGGNIDTYHLALRHLHETYPDADLLGGSYWEIAGDEMAACLKGPRKTVGHACEAETSMMLALRPDLVRQDEYDDCNMNPHPDFGGGYLPTNMQGKTRRGVVGYPASATAETGQQLLDVVVKRVTRAVQRLLNGKDHWIDEAA